MRLIGQRYALVLSALATVSVAVNLFALQDQRRPRSPNAADLGLVPVAADRVSAIERDALPGGALPSAGQDPGGHVPAVVPRVIATVEPVMASADLIRSVQRELNERKYAAGRPDGVAGTITRAAILAYEHDFGLPLTATPSQDLLSRIVLGSSASVGPVDDREPTEDAKTIIRQIKRQLSGLGYATGVGDGVVTAELSQAIRAFEQAHNLPVSGRISAPLAIRLAAITADAQNRAGAAKR